MKATDVARALRPSIVALTPRHAPSGRGDEFPPIIGTGVVVGDGLILTNEHVVDGLLRWRWRDPQDPEWPFNALLFHEIPERLRDRALGGGYATIPLQVLGVFHVDDVVLKPEGYYYGPRRPDFAIVHVKVRGLPSISFLDDVSGVEVGTDVLSLGYPMGTDALRAPGWMHQLSPMLQRGIVSAVLPFPCPNPHGFVIDIPSRGGASGSPVCLANDPRALGLLYAGLNDEEAGPVLTPAGPIATAVVPVPTAFSYIVSGHIIAAIVHALAGDERFVLPSDVKSLDEILDSAEFFTRKKPGEHEEPVRPGEALVPGPDWIDVGTVTVSPKSKNVKPG